MPPSSGRSSIGVRVRPNSHDFIRLLREDLKAKQYTFYVDVKAQTAPATRDVREWANTQLKKINATVNVSANLNQANVKVADWRRKIAGQTATINVDADMSRANRTVEQWVGRQRAREVEIGVTAKIKESSVDRAVKKAVQKTPTAATSDGLLKVNPAAQQRQAKKFRDDAQKLLNNLDPLKIDISASSDSARRMKDEFEKFTKGVAGGKRQLTLEADPAPAQKTMRELLTQFGKSDATINVDADTSKARTKVALTAEEIAHREMKAKLDLDTKQAKLALLQLRIEAQAKKLEVGVKVKKNALDSFGDELKDIEKKFGNVSVLRSLSLGPLNFGKPTGLLGTIASITALAGAVPGAVTAVTSLSKVIMDLAGAASIAPGALGVLAASIATMSIATSGVGAAFGSMFDLWNEGASAQASSAATLVSAHNSYRNAVVDEAKAQRDVGRARKEALGDLRDLNNELRGSVLNEAQAILDAQKARDRYAQGGFDNQTDQLQAQLDIAKADENLIDVRERNMQLQDKVNQANVQGVEGSDKVTDALEAQTRAAQATAASLAALSQGSGGALQQFNDALGLLSPNAKDFILTISGMKGEIQDFKMGLQDTFFQGLGPATKGLFDSLMPVIGPGMTGIAKAMNQNILQVFDTLKSPDGQSIIERILGGTEETQKALTKVIDPLINGVGTLVAAGAEHLPQVVELFGRLADRFATFISDADKDGSLDAFMDRGVTALGNIAELGINAIKIINDLSKSFSGDLLKTLVDTTERWHRFLSSDEGQAKLKNFIKEAGELWEKWRPILEDLPGIFSAASDGATTFINALTPFLNTFTEVMEHAPWLIEGFIGAWAGAKILTGVLSPVLKVIQWTSASVGKLIEGLKTVTNLAKTIPAIPGGTNTLTGPGTTPPLVATGGAGGVAAVAAAALPTAIVAGGLLYQLTQQIPQDNSLGPEDSKKKIDEINAQIPAGLPKYGSKEASQFIGGLGSAGGVGKWINDVPIGGGGEARRAARYAWLLTQPNATELIDSPDKFQAPPGFKDGGYTGDRGIHDGNLAILHGKEFVQPADATGYYGVDTMEKIRNKQIPKAFFEGYWSGGSGDPNDPRNINPTPGILDSLMQHGLQGVGSVASQAQTVSSGMGTGPAPGPAGGTAPATSGQALLDGMGAQGSPLVANIMGFQLPLGTAPGWPGGKPPVGLGGGDDGFDIRKFGIGPGPVGSGPGQWAQFALDQATGLGTGIATTLYQGALDGLGVGGSILSPNNKYTAAAIGIGSHFTDANGLTGDNKKMQGPGAGQTNTDVRSLLDTYGGLAQNPTTGAPGMMPDLFSTNGSALAGSGGKGLQINTARGEAIIKQMFPWATNIGGVRADALKWHPMGLALDVMTDPGHGNNDPPSAEGLAHGNQLVAWIRANQKALGVDYWMWQEKDHYNHVHVNFAASGYPDGSQPVGAPGGIAPPGGAWPNQSAKPPGSPANKNLTYVMGPAKGTPLQYGPDGSPIPWQTAKAPAGGGGGGFTIGGGATIPKMTRDSGGWIPTGTSLVTNNTGKPELAIPHHKMPSFYAGGLNLPPQGMVPGPTPPPPPRPNFDPGPGVQKINPAPTPRAETPPGPTAAPKPEVPLITPEAPPVNPEAPTTVPGPGGQAVSTAPFRPTTGVAPGDKGDHVLPALKTGIASTAATLGKLGDMALAAGTMGASAMAGGGGGGGGGGMGGGGGLSIAGLAAQGGKIATNIANVASSFLVGNITGGTTANPYGVTQRGSIPSGGTKVVDASQNHNGDIYTNDLDEYFARKRREDNKAAQSNLGRWGNA